MKKETLISVTCVESGKTVKSMVVSGDCRDEVSKEPSYSLNGKTIYRTARLITSAHRKTKWYGLTKKMGLRDSETGTYDVVTLNNVHLF